MLGLAFKPNTDDIRFAPAIEVMRRLIAEGAKVRASDPVAMERARLPSSSKGVEFVEDPYETARGRRCLALAHRMEGVRDLDWERIYARNGPAPDPGCAQYAVARKDEELGFEYHSFGRPDLSSSPALVST